MSRYIDADKLKNFFPDDGEGNWTYNVTAKAYIDSQPTADVRENRKGHWIEHENPKDVFSIECSECGCWFLHEHLVRNSFCPNCGADMRGANTVSDTKVDGTETII